VSLRRRAVALVAITNAGLFGVLGALALDDARESEKRERDASVAVAKELTSILGPLLDDALRSSDPSKPGLDLERVLSWPHWSRMKDAILLDANAVRLEAGGAVAVAGLFVNPLGVDHRNPNFDLGHAKRAVEEAMRGRLAVEDPRGVAVPVMSGGEIRGGAYFVFREPRTYAKSPLGLLVTFLASTVILTGILSYYVTHAVLRPIERLANVSGRIVSGDLSAVPEPHFSDDEVSALTASISAMLQTLRFHREDLERESALAADRAKRAERDLLTAQRLASLGTLAAGIAHEINNPLGGMQNAVRSLQSGGLPKDREKEYFELVMDGLQRIEGIVRRVLSMAPRGMSVAPVRIADALHDARALAEHRAEKAGVAVVLDGPAPGDPSSGDIVRGNRGELTQVFLNLFLNSIDAVEERRGGAGVGFAPRVEAKVSIEGHEVVVRVRDNGGGVTPEVLERIFDPFFTTKDPGRGSGLGLTVVYSIVRNHNATIAAANAPGGGFEATLRFPRFEEPRTSA
jgi:two-component system NtrC family sensor kinase